MGVDATFTPSPGIFGDLISVFPVYIEGAPNLVITVSNDTGITLTIGMTGGVPNLRWDQIAALFNADPASAIATMVGQVNQDKPLTSSVDNGGAAGLGLGQFYAAAAPGPPPPPPPPCPSPPVPVDHSTLVAYTEPTELEGS